MSAVIDAVLAYSDVSIVGGDAAAAAIVVVAVAIVVVAGAIVVVAGAIVVGVGAELSTKVSIKEEPPAGLKAKLCFT